MRRPPRFSIGRDPLRRPQHDLRQQKRLAHGRKPQRVAARRQIHLIRLGIVTLIVGQHRRAPREHLALARRQLVARPIAGKAAALFRFVTKHPRQRQLARLDKRQLPVDEQLHLDRMALAGQRAVVDPDLVQAVPRHVDRPADRAALALPAQRIGAALERAGRHRRTVIDEPSPADGRARIRCRRGIAVRRQICRISRHGLRRVRRLRDRRHGSGRSVLFGRSGRRQRQRRGKQQRRRERGRTPAVRYPSSCLIHVRSAPSVSCVAARPAAAHKLILNTIVYTW